jgi:DNA (cytosine-5)-methyltransferase 1
MNKYSKIKEQLKIEVDKNTDNGLAHLTHYFQNHVNGVLIFFFKA